MLIKNYLLYWIKNQKEDINLIVAMMEDKDHFEFMKSFKGIVNSVTVIDIPGEEGAISKNNLRDKIKNLNFNLKISNNIEEAIKLNSKNENQILLCIGSLYLTGKILNLN